MTVPKVLGLLIGFAGVIVLMSKDIGASIGPILGQLAVVVACMFYAGSSVYARKATTESSGIIRGAGPLFSSTAVMWLAAVTIERPITIPHLPITWIALLWLGVLGSGVAFILNYYLIHEIGPTRATMVAYILPFGGVILGAAFLHEQLSWQVLAGAIINYRQFSGSELATEKELNIHVIASAVGVVAISSNIQITRLPRRCVAAPRNDIEEIND